MDWESPPIEPLRESSYSASKFAALEHRKPSSARATQTMNAPTPVDGDSRDPYINFDEQASEAKYHNKVRQALIEEKTLAPIIKLASHKGQYAWLTSKARLVPSSAFKLSIMPRFALHHPQIPDDVQCPGCKSLLTSSTILNHIPGCAKCEGVNVTTKHHALVRYIYELCLKSGLTCEKEPRQFSSFQCSGCQNSVTEENLTEHQRSCRGSVRRSGPDLMIYWADGPMYYDLTVVHEFSAAHINKTPQKMMNEVITKKRDRYVTSGMIANDRFMCIPVLSGGALHKHTKRLLTALADRCLISRQHILEDFALYLQELNGNIVLSQMQKYLTPDKEEQYTI